MKKTYIVVGAIIATALVVLAVLVVAKQRNTAAEVKTTLTPVKIGYRAQDFYAPLFIGLEKGIFKKYGLDAEPVKFESTNQLIDALIAGRIDASLGGVNTFVLFTIEEKTPGYFKIFSLSMEDGVNPSTALVIPFNSTPKIGDLNNKKIAAYLGSSIKMMYERFVKVNNLQNTILIQMEPKLELSALEAGQVDAAFLLEPLVTVGQYKKISRPLESALFHKYFMNDIPLTASVVSQKFINEYPDAVKSLVQATDEGIGLIRNNSEELRKILPIYTGADPAVTALVPIVPFKKYSEMSQDKLAELSKLLLDLGEIKKPVDAQKMFLPSKYVEVN